MAPEIAQAIMMIVQSRRLGSIVQNIEIRYSIERLQVTQINRSQKHNTIRIFAKPRNRSDCALSNQRYPRNALQACERRQRKTCPSRRPLCHFLNPDHTKTVKTCTDRDLGCGKAVPGFHKSPPVAQRRPSTIGPPLKQRRRRDCRVLA